MNLYFFSLKRKIYWCKRAFVSSFSFNNFKFHLNLNKDPSNYFTLHVLYFINAKSSETFLTLVIC